MAFIGKQQRDLLLVIGTAMALGGGLDEDAASFGGVWCSGPVRSVSRS
jgi:hypothetical protein